MASLKPSIEPSYNHPNTEPYNQVMWDKSTGKFSPPDQSQAAKFAHLSGSKEDKVLRMECRLSDGSKSWALTYKVKEVDSLPFLIHCDEATKCEIGQVPSFLLQQRWNQLLVTKAEKKSIELPQDFDPSRPATHFLQSKIFKPADISGISIEESEDDDDNETFVQLNISQKNNPLLPNTRTKAKGIALKSEAKIRQYIEKKMIDSDSGWQDNIGTLDEFMRTLKGENIGFLEKNNIEFETSSIVAEKNIKIFLESESKRLAQQHKRMLICPLCIKSSSRFGRNSQHAVIAIITPKRSTIIDSKKPNYDAPNVQVTKFQTRKDRSSCVRQVAYTLTEMLKNMSAPTASRIKTFKLPRPEPEALANLF
ncbi:hypothetical protein JQC92_03200 [Shewanella sp. 202IG2-18]|uniref:hypothetical protein n=1 Tax=Parashewanella hymeniacidonis TaxID=2807618 RepID=UPI001961D9AA|nr:hypothetical protein [Parashewanella hymeniacidonis]MBM7071049.1 hypothetical protein [Parashewanella hymeniacidonis]